VLLARAGGLPFTRGPSAAAARSPRPPRTYGPTHYAPKKRRPGRLGCLTFPLGSYTSASFTASRPGRRWGVEIRAINNPGSATPHRPHTTPSPRRQPRCRLLAAQITLARRRPLTGHPRDPQPTPPTKGEAATKSDLPQKNAQTPIDTNADHALRKGIRHRRRCQTLRHKGPADLMPGMECRPPGSRNLTTTTVTPAFNLNVLNP